MFSQQQAGVCLLVFLCLLSMVTSAKMPLLLESPDQKSTSVAQPIFDGDDQLSEQQQAPVEDVPIDEIQNFIEVFQLIKSNYVAPVDDNRLFRNAMHGLVEQLDPYSRYLDEEHYKQLMDFTEGQIAKPQFELKYNQHQNNWKISGVVRNSENHHLGLRDGQLVERIDGINIQSLDQRTITNLLTGALGSILRLRTKDEAHTQNFDVIRDQKLNYDVQASLSEHHILVLHIQAFQQETTRQVTDIISQYHHKALRGILIDIRDNPGGLLSAAVDLADVFLEQGLIVSTKSRIEPTQSFQAMPSSAPISYPIAILQNRFSASASEVFSAALKQHKRAIIYGETSYGKGAVQKLFPLKQGALQLTVSHYYTPNGTMIEGRGIEADQNFNLSGFETEQQLLSYTLGLFDRYISLSINNKR